MNREIDEKLAELGFSSRDDAYASISSELSKVSILEYRRLKKLLEEINDADEMDEKCDERLEEIGS
jgi:hypothetical protein